MGTSLTGLTPATTYDALIKVGDNGPLSATAKVLSDGLGNDSPLAMSTTLVGIGTATPTLGKLSVKDGGFQYIAEPADTATFGYLGVGHFSNGAYIGTNAGTNTVSDILRLGTTGTERMRIDSAGNVGIGKTVPDTKLHVAGADAWITLQRTSGSTNILDFTDSTAARIGYVGAIGSNISILSTGSVVFGANSAEVGRFTANGLTFNGDTAAANALDDYEEGTWTPSLGGTTTYLGQVGTYTKIGRQVTVNFYLGVNVLGTGSGSDISGLPFTAFSVSRGGGGLAFAVSPSSNYTSINPLVNPGTATIIFVTSTTLGVWADNSTVFTGSTQISGTCTYFV